MYKYSPLVHIVNFFFVLSVILKNYNIFCINVVTQNDSFTKINWSIITNMREHFQIYFSVRKIK